MRYSKRSHLALITAPFTLRPSPFIGCNCDSTCSTTPLLSLPPPRPLVQRSSMSKRLKMRIRPRSRKKAAVIMHMCHRLCTYQ